MKVTDRFSKYFEQKGLRRVRFKVDPTITSGFDTAQTYEGYVIKENADGSLTIYLPDGDFAGVHDFQEVVPIPDRLGPIKCKIAKVLQGKKGEEYLPQIMQSDCFMEIQQYLRDSGFSDTDIIDLLKCVITNEGAIGKFAKKVGNAILSAPEAITNFQHKVDDTTRYLKTFSHHMRPGGSYVTKQHEKDAYDPIRSGTTTVEELAGDPYFVSWYAKKYGFKNDMRRAKRSILAGSQSNAYYWARKYFEFTGIRM